MALRGVTASTWLYRGKVYLPPLFFGLFGLLVISTASSAYAKPLNIQGVDTDPKKKAANEQKFKDLLGKCSDESPAFKTLHERVDVSAKTINAKVGRGFLNVMVDAFKTDEIDLDDLETFPHPTKVEEAGKTSWKFPDGFEPWAQTVCQTIAHVLSERLYSLENNEGYLKSHVEAIKEENKIRPGFNQTSIVINREFLRNPDGTCVQPDDTCHYVETYSDGKRETYKVDRNYNFVGTPIFTN